MSSARSLHVLASLTLVAVGCASGEATSPKARAPAKAGGPPNAVMLDYMTPEELLHSKQLEAQAAAPLPGAIGEKDPPPRIRQTVVIGRNNPDPVWETDHPSAGGYDDPGANRPSEPPSYHSGPVYYYRGGGAFGGAGGAQGGGPGTPRVGGDWPTAPSYGPRPMR